MGCLLIVCTVRPKQQEMLQQALSRMQLSAKRLYHPTKTSHDCCLYLRYEETDTLLREQALGAHPASPDLRRLQYGNTVGDSPLA